MKKQVEFIKDFATKKKGDLYTCDSMMASHMVNVQKVAKYVELDKKETVKKGK